VIFKKTPDASMQVFFAVVALNTFIYDTGVMGVLGYLQLKVEN